MSHIEHQTCRKDRNNRVDIHGIPEIANRKKVRNDAE